MNKYERKQQETSNVNQIHKQQCSSDRILERAKTRIFRSETTLISFAMKRQDKAVNESLIIQSVLCEYITRQNTLKTI